MVLLNTPTNSDLAPQLGIIIRSLRAELPASEMTSQLERMMTILPTQDLQYRLACTIIVGGAAAMQVPVEHLLKLTEEGGLLQGASSLFQKALADMIFVDSHSAYGPNDRSILNAAIERDRHLLVRALLHYGASANLQDRSGVWPLHMAAWRGRREIVDELSRRTPDKSILDNTGRTALEIAQAYGHGDLAGLLS